MSAALPILIKDIERTAQHLTMEYLARANRFSRSPTHAAAYLGATRGTTTQTFKALARKGYILEER